MIIHYITNARIPTEKAHGYQIVKMCEALGTLNHDVTLVVPWRKNSPALKGIDPFDYYDAEKNFTIKRLLVLDLIGLATGLPAKIQYLLFLAHSLWFTFVSLIHCIFHKPELIITRDNMVAYILSFFADIIYESHLFSSNKLTRYFERSSCKRIRRFIVITENLKNVYSRHGFNTDKFFVLPDSVDLRRFDIDISKKEARKEIGLPQDAKIIGYIGRFQTLGIEKGIKDIIKSIKYLSDIELITVFVGGPMNLVPEYVKVAEEEGITKDKFIFKDRIAHHEVPLYLKAFDCCVMPFPWNEHYAYFMSPLKMFEYMASKRPIIATNLPSIQEILDDTMAVLVSPGDDKGLSEAIRKVLTNENFALSIASNAFQKVQKYTWLIRAEEILKAASIECKNGK